MINVNHTFTYLSLSLSLCLYLSPSSFLLSLVSIRVYVCARERGVGENGERCRRRQRKWEGEEVYMRSKFVEVRRQVKRGIIVKICVCELQISDVRLALNVLHELLCMISETF